MHVHILEICGTFMGSLALLAKAMGYRVTGSDQNIYPPMSEQLDRLEQYKKNPNFFLKGVPRDYLSKLKIKAKKISPPQIKSLRKKIADLDKDFKTGKAEFWTELRKIIVNFGYI